MVKQLKGISGPTPVWDGQGGQILSTPDAIAKVLERYIESRGQAAEHPASPVPHAGSHSTAGRTQGDEITRTVSTCPECGSTVEHVSGCVVCYNCGWSKC